MKIVAFVGAIFFAVFSFGSLIGYALDHPFIAVIMMLIGAVLLLKQENKRHS